MNLTKRDATRWASAALLGSLVPGFQADAAAQTSAAPTVNFALNRGPFDASNAPFLLAREAGYDRQGGVDVRFSLSKDAEDALHRVASNTFDFAYLDFSVLLRFACEHPGDSPIYVLNVFDASPASIVTWKSAGVRGPADLRGKQLAAVETDGAYQLFDAYTHVAGLDRSSVTMKMTTLKEREKLMAARQVDGAVGFDSTILANLQVAGVSPSDVDIAYYADGGLPLLSNGIVVSQKMMKDNPERVVTVVRACARGWRDALNRPSLVTEVLATAEPGMDREREDRRFAWIRDRQILTPAVRKSGGFGTTDAQRVAGLISKIAPPGKRPQVGQVCSNDFVPALYDRSVPT